ncbi:MAG: PilZ domain-containing protein [bacterium]|nr:PilZ domain-containing protein [bacterium]
MTTTGSERRGARRVDAKLSVQVSLPGVDGASTATLETINISSSGVYFRSDRFLEPLTKLALELELEVPALGDAPAEPRLFPCEGMVVRSIPEVEAPDCKDYEIAVFFTHLEDDSAAALEQHIAANLSRQD